MKATNKLGKQSGFFSVGIGLALFAIFGAIGTGITVGNNTYESDNEKLALQAEVNSAPDSINKQGSRGVK